MKIFIGIFTMLMIGCISDDEKKTPPEKLLIGSGTYQAVDSVMQLLHQVDLAVNPNPSAWRGGEWTWKTWTSDSCLITDANGSGWETYTRTYSDSVSGVTFSSPDGVRKNRGLTDNAREFKQSSIAGFNCATASFTNWKGFAGLFSEELVWSDGTGFMMLRNGVTLLNGQPSPKYNIFYKKIR